MQKHWNTILPYFIPNHRVPLGSPYGPLSLDFMVIFVCFETRQIKLPSTFCVWKTGTQTFCLRSPFVFPHQCCMQCWIFSLFSSKVYLILHGHFRESGAEFSQFSKIVIAWPSLPYNITLMPSYRDATPPSWFVWRGWGVLFPVLSVKERKRRRKKNRERGREKETAAKASGYWFVVMQSESYVLKREEEGGAGGGLPLSFLPLTKFIQPLPRGKLPKRDPFRAKQPEKIHKNMITEPLSLQRTLHSLEEGTNFNDMGRKPSVVCLHLCGARVKGDVWKETSVERWRKVREGWRELYVWGERGR